MVSFLLALQFLTTLPLKIGNFNDKRMPWALVYFPVVGLLLGLMLAGLAFLLSGSGISDIAADIILVVVLIIFTGGMHLDGLADTADAFLSGKTKKEMLEIMRDPHIGVMGVVSLISIILLKIGLIFSVNAAVKPPALILMCVLSRWVVVLAMYLFPYARQEGKAKLFIQGLNFKILIISITAVIIFSFLIWQVLGLITFLAVAFFSYLFGIFVNRKIGGVTGDTLGAEIEITEIITLSLVIILGNIWG